MVLQSPLPDWLSRACQGHHTQLLFHFAKEQRIEPPKGYQKYPLIRSQETITFKVLSRERRARQALDTPELFSFYSPFKREEPPLDLVVWRGPASADKQVSPLATAAPMLPGTTGLLRYCRSFLDLTLASGIHCQLLGSLPRAWVHPSSTSVHTQAPKIHPPIPAVHSQILEVHQLLGFILGFCGSSQPLRGHLTDLRLQSDSQLSNPEVLTALWRRKHSYPSS